MDNEDDKKIMKITKNDAVNIDQIVGERDIKEIYQLIVRERDIFYSI